MKYLKNLLVSFALLLAIGIVVLAQETIMPTVNEVVNLDENIQPEDLAIGKPRILPDSPLYFLKDWQRKIQSFFTFNTVDKAELKEKFANEKLMELKKMIEEKKNAQSLKRAAENYQEEIEKVKNQVEKIKEKAKDHPKVESFLDKFIHQQILHEKLLQKLETQVPPEAFEKIKEAREKHLEKFLEVMFKLEDRKEKITEKLDKILEEQKGSKFKNFKNLEVLNNLARKAPEETKEAIKKAEESVLTKLKEDLENMPPEDQEKFKEYLQQISGEKEIQLEILENLKEKIKQSPQKQKMIELKEKLEEEKIKMIKNIENEAKKMNCQVQPIPNPNSCKEGKVIIEKDPKTGCLISLKCIQTEEKNEQPQFCPTIWDPVCGKDGKTYSNECFAKLENVQVDYKGVCKNEKEIPFICAQVITYCIDPDSGQCRTYSSSCSAPKPCKPCQIERPSPVECKNLWWFDNEHKFCQQKNFCGLYMYEGLKTFQTKEECESVLQNE